MNPHPLLPHHSLFQRPRVCIGQINVQAGIHCSLAVNSARPDAPLHGKSDIRLTREPAARRTADTARLWASHRSKPQRLSGENKMRLEAFYAAIRTTRRIDRRLPRNRAGVAAAAMSVTTGCPSARLTFTAVRQ